MRDCTLCITIATNMAAKEEDTKLEYAGAMPTKSARELIDEISHLSQEEQNQFTRLFSLQQNTNPPVRTRSPSRSAFMMNTVEKVPHISPFSGSGKDMNYQRWRIEVVGLLEVQLYSEMAILQEIRRSVRGLAADVLVQMSSVNTVRPVIDKFDLIFGNVLPAKNILEQFLSAQQKQEEDVIMWGIRLEDLANQLQRKDPSMLSGDATRSTLRNKFWSGLRDSDLKNALRHTKDTTSSFDDLLMEARRLSEIEFSNKKSAKTHQITEITPNLADKLDKILSLQTQMLDISERLERLENRRGSGHEKNYNTKSSKSTQQRNTEPNGQRPKRFNGKCYNCQKWGHPKFLCPSLNSSESARKGDTSA